MKTDLNMGDLTSTAYMHDNIQVVISARNPEELKSFIKTFSEIKLDEQKFAKTKLSPVRGGRS